MAKTNYIFRKVATVPTSGLVVGCIYFETSTRQVKVATSATATQAFGGNIKDASFAEGILTITKNSGESITLNFGDVASASQTMAVFEELRAAIGGKVSGVGAGSGVEIGGSAVAPTVAVKVKTGDKVLSVDANGVASTLNLAYDSAAKKIVLSGKGGTEIASVDATAFIKDGMVESVSFDPATKILTITFNTDSGKESIPVDLGSLVDTYTAGKGISITGNVISLNVNASGIDLSSSYAPASSYAAPAAGDSLEEAIGKLAKGIEDASAGGVQSVGGQSGAITVRGSQSANGAINLTMSGKEIQASAVGLKSAAFQESSAFDAAGAAATAEANAKAYADGFHVWAEFE